MRSISPIELLAVMFAGFAALAASYQSYIAQQGLEIARLSNLQNRQIDYCYSFISKGETLLATLIVWGQVARKEPPFGDGWIGDDTNKMQMRAIEAGNALIAAFAPLRLFAGQEVMLVTKRLNDKMDDYTNIVRQDIPSKNVINEWSSKFNSDLKVIEDRCRDVVVGVRGGKL